MALSFEMKIVQAKARQLFPNKSIQANATAMISVLQLVESQIFVVDNLSQFRRTVEAQRILVYLQLHQGKLPCQSTEEFSKNLRPKIEINMLP